MQAGRQPVDGRPVNAEGSLPTGCTVAATLDRAALGPLREIAGRLISSSGANGAALTAIDFDRDVRFIKFCKTESKGSFVVLMSGKIPADALEKASAAGKSSIVRESMDGVPVVGREAGWFARRGANPKIGEIVMASDRGLLRSTLFGISAAYATDSNAPLSVVMAPVESRDRLSHHFVSSHHRSSAADRGSRRARRPCRAPLRPPPARPSYSARSSLR